MARTSAVLRLVAVLATIVGAPVSALAQDPDADLDTMPDAWELFFGLNPNDASDATGDPDGDGVTNAQEFAARRHPFGHHARYFAEGATGYFDTNVAVLNLSATNTAHVALALLNEGGAPVSYQLTLMPQQRQTVSLNAIPGLASSVSIIVESDEPVAADRSMSWGTQGVGSSLDSGAPAPATTWYIAEGATAPFLLYYLLENPNATPATATVRYLPEGGSPIVKTYPLPPNSRTTIDVSSEDPSFASVSLGAVITSDAPILTERAMYVNAGGTFGGGSAASANGQLATQWFFGEGATGPFFHAFLALLNPGTTPATATVTYHMSDGTAASKSYEVPAEGRRTVYFNGEAATDPALTSLALGAVWFSVSSTAPIAAERAMWWSNWPWYEGHAAPGSTIAGASWAIAEGRFGGSANEQTFVLVGNTTGTDGTVRLTLIPDSGASSTRDVPIPASERTTINVGELFGLSDARFSLLIDSLAPASVPIVVDYARYRSVNGLPFSGGAAAAATLVATVETAPSVTATTPSDGATGIALGANLSVTFSEAVNVASGAFVLECPIGSPIALTNLTASPAASFTLDPATNLPLNTVCRLTVAASAVTDADVNDPPDGLAADVTVTFTTTNANQAPSFTAGPNQTVSEDAGPQTVASWATAISPGPAGESGQTVSFLVTGNTNAALFSAAPTVSPTGTLTYAPAPNAFGTADVTLVLQDSGGTAGGGANTSAPQTFTISVASVNDGPGLTNATIGYSTAGNTQLHVAGATLAGVASIADASGVLAKSVPIDSDGPSAPAVVPFSGATPNGSVMINADGSFTYVPAAGFTGVDSFSFQVTDSAASVSGTINVTVSQRVWYVNNQTGPNNPAGGDGRSTDAFETLTAAETASAANDTIFVFNGISGTTPYERIELKNGQKLHGEGVGLTVGSFGTLVPAGTQPQIAALPIGNAVTVVASLANGDRTGIEIRGLNLESATGNGIDVTSSGAANVGVRISENTISGSGAGEAGIDIGHGSTGTGALAVQNNTITAAGFGIGIVRTAGTVTITAFNDNTITGNTGGGGIVVTGPSVIFDAAPGGALDPVSGGTTRIGASGNGVGNTGLVLSSVTGALDFVDLDIFSESVALGVTGSGTFNGASGTRVSVTPGASTLSATAGPAAFFSSLTLDLQLGGLTSANSAGDGVTLASVDGIFTAPSGASISDATGIDFQISGGTATVAYAGTITDDLGTLVSIANTAGGTIAFTGAITDGNDGDGGGIALTNNPGATITFSGGLLLSTGTSPAFTATGGGTIDICDENPCNPAATGALVNTLTTTTGTALNVNGTTIGANNLEFRSISSNGAASGIVLNTTGSSGGLTVRGTGSAGTGGTIQGSTGPGISLISTAGVNLSDMNILNGGDDGIRGSGVAGFNLTNVNITSNGNAAGESGIEMTQLTGSGGLASTTVSGSSDRNVHIANTSGVLTAFNVTGSTFTTTDATTGDDGFLVESNGGATMSVSVTGSTFTDNRDAHFQASADASATGSLGVTFTGNTLTTTAPNDPNVVGGGIRVGSNGSADVAFTIGNNNIQQAFDDAIELTLGAASTGAASLVGTVSTNIIGTSGDADSGSETGVGINVASSGAGVTTVSVTDNQVFQYAGISGVLLQHGTSTMNATVTGNTVASPGTSAVNGIHVSSGATPGDNGLLCVGLSANSAAGSGPGVDTDIRLLQQFLTSIRLPGYGGANNDTAAVNTFVAGNNPGADVSSLDNVASGGGGFIGGGAPCTTP